MGKMIIYVFGGNYSSYNVGAGSEERAEKLAREEGMDECHHITRINEDGEEFVER